MLRWIALLLLSVSFACLWPMKPDRERQRRISECLKQCPAAQSPSGMDNSMAGAPASDTRSSCEASCHRIR
jgi:hypothetical protein